MRNGNRGVVAFAVVMGAGLLAGCAPTAPDDGDGLIAHSTAELGNERKPQVECGNGVCSFGETCETCARDCGRCSTTKDYCGDGVCGRRETCGDCSRDCCPQCEVASDCSGTSTFCATIECRFGVCVVGRKAPGTALPSADQTSGDCRLAVCDGQGGFTTQPDANDVPTSEECQIASCTSDGNPTSTPAADGTACGSGGSCLAGVCEPP